MQMDRDQAANLRPSFFLRSAYSRDKKRSLMTHEEFVRVARDLAEHGEGAPTEESRDQDQGKGAVEQDQKNQGGNTSMNGQLGHRDQEAELKKADSDRSGWDLTQRRPEVEPG
jgi:hypothetical protein